MSDTVSLVLGIVACVASSGAWWVQRRLFRKLRAARKLAEHWGGELADGWEGVGNVVQAGTLRYCAYWLHDALRK